ncbi:MAG: hypothetical protein SFW64_08910 [Alphaproteobacteria bacterium]|nr:hypothetical protein [Alphaproteobacteria bacterium]
MAHIGDTQMQSLIDAQVFGARGEWEKHEIGGKATYIKAIATHDVQMKARIASRFDELGFVPKFFREGASEFVALEDVKQSRYADVESAFVAQILRKL